MNNKIVMYNSDATLRSEKPLFVQKVKSLFGAASRDFVYRVGCPGRAHNERWCLGDCWFVVILRRE